MVHKALRAAVTHQWSQSVDPWLSAAACLEGVGSASCQALPPRDLDPLSLQHTALNDTGTI